MSDETPPRRTKHTEPAGDSRQQILDIATRLMAERGYDGTSMSLLSKEAGLPGSSIYWHFGSKEGVLAAVMERGVRHFLNAFPELEGLEGSSSDRLHRALVHTGTSLITDPQHSQFLQLQMRFRVSREAHRGKSFYALAQSVRAEGTAFMRALIFQAYAQHGDVVAGRIADELAEFGVALIDGIYIAEKGGMRTPISTMLDRAATSLVALAEEILPQAQQRS